MKVNLLKFNNTHWVIIPKRNTVQEVLDLYNKLNLNEFTDLFKMNIIEDNNGQPDIFNAVKIIKEHSDIENIDFELYECL